jgi:hypothetical protein
VAALALRTYLGLPVPALQVALDFDPAPPTQDSYGEERASAAILASGCSDPLVRACRRPLGLDPLAS